MSRDIKSSQRANVGKRLLIFWVDMFKFNTQNNKVLTHQKHNGRVSNQSYCSAELSFVSSAIT